MSGPESALTINKQGASNRATAARTRKAPATAGAASPKPRASRAKGTAKSAKTQAAETQSVHAAPKTTPLAKLAAEEAKQQPVAAGAVHTVPMDRITFGLNPREHFDTAGIEELAASIKANGGQPMQPPTVRPLGNGMYQMIAGERRYRAMQALGKREINVIVRNASDEEAKKLALTENIARRDMLPGETGRAYQTLKQEGMSVDEIAKTAGKSVQSVKDHLALVETLEPHLQKLVDTGAKEGRGKGLAFSLVGPLSQLTPAHREQAAEKIMSKGMGVKAAKNLIDALHARENQMTLFGAPEHSSKTKSAHERYSQAMERLTTTLGGLDNETIDTMIPAVASPAQEQERVRLAIRQLQRIEAVLGRAAAHGEAAGM